MPDDSTGGSETGSQEDKVLYSTYSKAVKEKKKLAEEAMTLRSRLAEYEAEKEAIEREKLEKQGEYQKLLAMEKEKAQKVQSEYQMLNKKIQDSQKLHAFIKSVGGQVDEKYWSLIPIDKIGLNEEGNVDEASLTQTVTEWLGMYGPEIVKKPGVGKMPNQAATGGATLTHEEWLKLPAHEMRKRYHEVLKS